MDEQAVRKTYKYKLNPTPEQERAMGFILRRCRELYNAGLQERRDAWQKCGVSISVAGQRAQLPGIKEVRPEYRDVHSQVLQDVLTRLDRAFQAFFRRVTAGETPGYPRFQGSNRYNSFTYKQFGNGATLNNGYLVLAKIGRIAVRWSRPVDGTPKTVTVSQEADGWYVCFSCTARACTARACTARACTARACTARACTARACTARAAHRTGDRHRPGPGIVRHAG
jgi:transposase